MEGIFITIEGVDTCGKSTQIESLKTKLMLDGYDVKILHFPNYEGKIGKLISSILKSGEPIDEKALQYLYIADQLNHKKQIQDWMHSGAVVISDRYDLSTAVYYAALTEYKNNFYSIFTLAQNNFLRPNATFILDMDVEEIKKRKSTLDKFEENEELMQSVCSLYKNIKDYSHSLKNISLDCDRELYHIDATKNVNEISTIIYNRTIKIIEGAEKFYDSRR